MDLKDIFRRVAHNARHNSLMRQSCASVLLAALMLSRPDPTAADFLRENFSDIANVRMGAHKSKQNGSIMAGGFKMFDRDNARLDVWARGDDTNDDGILQEREITSFGFCTNNIYKNGENEFVIAEKTDFGFWDVRYERSVNDVVIEKMPVYVATKHDLVDVVRKRLPAIPNGIRLS